ncbi:hypothetical protein [Flavobacterium oreochromis]|uniref:Uncharacterized protein n=1 Tax=Flavobacterium columnare TaxID=996 RepID=A0A246G9S3_9FLAO|nr:hypothetical protein [Flavobacterium oreochromis]OWP76523.1 hypothetical protein BWK62_09300 [Flavobacterium oreochromis]
MNYQKFNQSGGFPIKTQTLEDMQLSWQLLNSLGEIAGNFAILKGCEESNGTVSDGVVYINGEVLDFVGGVKGTTVIITETAYKREFKDGSNKDVLFIRKVMFGIGSVTFNWADFKRPKSTIQLTADLKAVNEELPKKADQTLIQSLINRIVELEKRPMFNNPIKNKGYFTLGDITGGQPVGSNLPVYGDCVSAVVSSYVDGGNHYIDVSFLNPMLSVNYKVNLMVESLGTMSNDDDAGNPVFKIIDTNKFKVGLYEAASTVQSIRIHFEITEL